MQSWSIIVPLRGLMAYAPSMSVASAPSRPRLSLGHSWLRGIMPCDSRLSVQITSPRNCHIWGWWSLQSVTAFLFPSTCAHQQGSQRSGRAPGNGRSHEQMNAPGCWPLLAAPQGCVGGSGIRTYSPSFPTPRRLAFPARPIRGSCAGAGVPWFHPQGGHPAGSSLALGMPLASRGAPAARTPPSGLRALPAGCGTMAGAHGPWQTNFGGAGIACSGGRPATAATPQSGAWITLLAFGASSMASSSRRRKMTRGFFCGGRAVLLRTRLGTCNTLHACSNGFWAAQLLAAGSSPTALSGTYCGRADIIRQHTTSCGFSLQGFIPQRGPARAPPVAPTLGCAAVDLLTCYTPGSPQGLSGPARRGVPNAPLPP